MLGLSPAAVAGLLSLLALVLAGALAAFGQAYVAITNRRSALDLAKLSAPTGDNYSRTIEGFTRLLEAQSHRLDELEEEVAAARRDARAAAMHVAECERELAFTRSRLAALENGAS